MADIGAMSLQQLREYQTQVQTSVDSIISTVSNNRFAMLSLCNRPDFLELCQKKYGLQSSEVAQFIRDHLGVDAAPERSKAPVDVASLVGGQVKIWEAPRKGRGSGRRSQLRHFLRMGDGFLTGRGFSELKTDKEETLYEWLDPAEYIRFWTDACNDRQNHGYWYGIYSISYTAVGGDMQDFISSDYGYGDGFGHELKVKDVDATCDTISCFSYSLAGLCKRLMAILYDMYGDMATQTLYELVMSSWVDTPGVDKRYSQFFVPMTYLKSNGVDTSSSPWKYIVLPGKVAVNGVEDELVYNYASVKSLRPTTEPEKSNFYYSVNNERFYVDLAMKLVRKMSDGRHDDIKDFCERVKFLVRPGHRE